MRAGKLNKKVSIEAQASVTTTDGGTKPAWTEIASGVWAAIEPLGGKEWVTAGGTQSEANHRIRIRYLSGIKTSMRVVHKDRFFDIQYVADVRSEGRELHLMCKEYGED